MIVLVGLIAGWLPGQLVTGGRFGVIGDVAIGIVGALIGSWLLATPGLHVCTELVSAVVVTTIGRSHPFTDCRTSEWPIPRDGASGAALLAAVRSGP